MDYVVSDLCSGSFSEENTVDMLARFLAPAQKALLNAHLSRVSLDMWQACRPNCQIRSGIAQSDVLSSLSCPLDVPEKKRHGKLASIWPSGASLMVKGNRN